VTRPNLNTIARLAIAHVDGWPIWSYFAGLDGQLRKQSLRLDLAYIPLSQRQKRGLDTIVGLITALLTAECDDLLRGVA
jgi:hypothetical protein